MFQTVRHWWSGGRGKVTARLFAFEFAVVVVGVLVAQGLANWVQERGDDRRVHEEQIRLNEEVARVRANALELKPILQCFDDRLTWILDQARAGHRFTRAELARPGIPRYPPSPTPPELAPLLRDRLGTDLAERYESVMFTQSVLDDFFVTLRDGWAELEMLDTDWGPPGGADPAGIRRSAIRLRLAIAKMRARAQDAEAEVASLGIAPHFRTVDGATAAPIRDCARLFVPVRDQL